MLLEYVFDHKSAEQRYAAVAERLRRDGHEADHVRDREGVDLGAYGLLLTHGPLSADVLAVPGLRCFGGHPITRVEALELLEAAGVPAMAWARAGDRAAVLELFDRWDVDALILKRSGTCGGHGTVLFDRANLDRLDAWDGDADVFCPIVNPRSGTVYKAELFNGDAILSLCSRSAPVLDPSFDGYTVRLEGIYGRRRRHPLAPWVWRRLRAASAELTRRGFGCCSVDMMRTARGRLVAIEVNTELVATWWTARFAVVTDRYAESVARLVNTIDAGDAADPRRR